MKKKNLLFLIIVFIVISIFTLGGCANKSSTEYDVVKLTKMNNFELLNQSAKHNQVVFIGDSIVELFPTYELFTDYDKIVYNRGISGDTSDKMLERLEKNALNINPEIVYILIGTNDIARGIEHSVIIDNISQSIDKCKEKNVKKIIVSGLLPVNKSLNSKMVGMRSNKEIKELNEKINSLTKDKGVNFASLIDTLEDSEGNFKKNYTYDGLHPNALGYIEMSKVLANLM